MQSTSKTISRVLSAGLGLALLSSTSRADVFSVTTPGDDGSGTLRQAILDANANPGPDKIVVSFAGEFAGETTVYPLSELPPVSGPVELDGSLPGGVKAELSGAFLGGWSPSGFTLIAQGCTIQSWVIRDFPRHGVEMLSGYCVVRDCLIGTDATGTLSSPNGASGICIVSPGNLVGGPNPGDRNLLSGNAENGVLISDFNGSSDNGQDNHIEGNYIGTDITGMAALPNLMNGVHISEGEMNVVGGPAQAQGNLISGNAQHGVLITGYLYYSIDEQDAEAGGFEYKIVVVDGSWGGQGGFNEVLSNFVGTDKTGLGALGNGLSGVGIQGGVGNLVGMSAAKAGAAPGNLISGNGSYGVEITGEGEPGYGHSVQGNLIGTDASGVAALANVSGGVAVIESPENLIGGVLPTEGNVISGNGGCGVLLGESSSPWQGNLSTRLNRVCGNMIGTQADGQSPLGNAEDGVRLESLACDNLVGEALFADLLLSTPTSGAGNLIAFNLDDGVEVTHGERNAITFNLLRSNGQAGIRVVDGYSNCLLSNLMRGNGTQAIDLEPASGPTPNDEGDTDTGANNLQNYPDLYASTGGGVMGSMDTLYGGPCLLEFFSSVGPGGQGEKSLGMLIVYPKPNDKPFRFRFPVPPGDHHTELRATATWTDGSTSELSTALHIQKATGPR